MVDRLLIIVACCVPASGLYLDYLQNRRFIHEILMLSRLVDTFFSRTSWTILLYPDLSRVFEACGFSAFIVGIMGLAVLAMLLR